MDSKSASLVNESPPSSDAAVHLERLAADEEKHVGHVGSLPVEGYADSLEKSQGVYVDVTNRDAVKGDESDGKVDWTWLQITATVCLSGLYVGSQIPLYFLGGTLTYISADLGGTKASAWLPVAYSLALGAVTPFCGYLQDLLGRRYVTLTGGTILLIGCIVMATAQNFRSGVVAMCFAGAGASIGELTAVAGTAELVPIKKRGIYLSIVTASILPFAPYLLYAQLLAKHATWRWGMWLCVIWNAVWFTGIAITYFPKSQTRARGVSRRAALKRIDYIGGLLSIIGLVLFLIALQAGGSSHPWKSAYVLVNLFIGFSLLVAFFIWEWKFARYPMIPKELFQGQNIVASCFVVAFVSGMNFSALLNFFPLEFTTVFVPDPIQIGLKDLPAALLLIGGSVATNALLSYLRGHGRELMLVGCLIMSPILYSTPTEPFSLGLDELISSLLAASFSGALASITPNGTAAVIGIGSMAALGVGMVTSPASTIAITVAPDSTIATCVALIMCIRATGGSIGYAIYYNVFIEKLTPALPKYVAEYAVAAGLPIGEAEPFTALFLTAPQNVTEVPGVNAAIVEAATIGSRWAYAHALKYVWYISLVFGICSIVACCFVNNMQKYMTNRIAAKVGN
ncbi:uncharacterized protein Z520_02511 [Fonsecaea multimorphosa CBS 102226]|uniref:Major facilitator superfamily (MFS) profile domain-containing protein n=1 Tax=Fonsecaea multimorphosa CBS 102226 TaxID=1442371 RepID=A0A0D2K8H7_9EURO|nr:uncharacterized protein Z520_02511 [Fonsecaea multimorphosa CBS 102226]KIY02373.1 hypothetical protein Z520_02511 [Fonsecaea multimorphosa CBS 102226]OAL29015.1 hypothetical protein AYO22_02451 [Fonsecaea multimorphosa]